jgi:hypothetical protein
VRSRTWIRHVCRIHLDLELAQRLVHDRAAGADVGRHADEDERDAHGDGLAGHQLLEVHVQDLALERVALDLADERAAHLAVDRQLDDRALVGDVLQQAIEVAGRDGERLRLAAVAVDDAGNLAVAAEGAGDALAGVGAGGRGE